MTHFYIIRDNLALLDEGVAEPPELLDDDRWLEFATRPVSLLLCTHIHIYYRRIVEAVDCNISETGLKSLLSIDHPGTSSCAVVAAAYVLKAKAPYACPE
jgi:hypothetical protein